MTEHDLTPEERELAERGAALVAAAVAQERAPLALRERIEADRARAAAQPRRGMLRVLGPVAAGLAAVVAAVVVLASGGGATAPTVAAVAGLSLQGHERPAPARVPTNPVLLSAAIDGLAFPEWAPAFPWTASGQRDDEIGGRRALTVFYVNPKGAELGYSIVAGDALKVPDGEHRAVGGIDFVVVREGKRQVVTWRRQGHTCVISAPAAVATAKLLELAAWKGAS